MSLDAIQAAIPHREPFLLVDEIVEQTDTRIVCRKRFTGDEFWYRGHYPDFPITPGVLLCEAAMQAGAVLLARRVGRVGETHQDSTAGGSRASTHPTRSSNAVPVVTRMNNVKFKSMVRPGDTIELQVTFKEQLGGAYFMEARVANGEKTAVTFDFVCKLASVEE
jgi:3-hydroxyacyl-[acyl-carrier-protein] dehydratase